MASILDRVLVSELRGDVINMRYTTTVGNFTPIKKIALPSSNCLSVLNQTSVSYIDVVGAVLRVLIGSIFQSTPESSRVLVYNDG